MRTPSRRTQRVLAATATPLAVLAAVAMVYRATDVAFSSQTRSLEDRTSAPTSSPPTGTVSPDTATSAAGPRTPATSQAASLTPTTPSSTASPSAAVPTQPPPTEPPVTTLTLSDDDNGAARFVVADMVPGDSGQRCIRLTAKAGEKGTVRGYAANPVFSSVGLEDHIFLTVETGAKGSFESCDGFVTHETIVPSLPLSTIASMDSYEAGLPGWDVDRGTSIKVYRLTWEFDTSGLSQAQVNRLQGTQTGLDMVWELRSS